MANRQDINTGKAKSNPRASVDLWSANNIRRAWHERWSNNMSNSPGDMQTESETAGKGLIQDTPAEDRDTND